MRLVVFRQGFYRSGKTGKPLNLRRNDDLGGFSVRHLRKRLQRTELDYRIRRSRLVDTTDSFRRGFLNLENGGGFTLRLLDAGFLHGFRVQNRRLLFGFGRKDHGFFLSFGNQNRALLFAFGSENGFPAFAFRLHLFFHSIPDCGRRHDVFQFHTVDLDAPRVGGNVQN